MNRDAALAMLNEHFDMLVIGGGATGLGAAVDAAARGYRTALIEAADFANATSSRSTKLVHGGVRYLRNGEIGLVREALAERTNLLRNAPHVVQDLPFVLPAYGLGDLLYYRTGLVAYDLLAGRSNLPHSSMLTARETLALVPQLRAEGLRGAILYHDGQFDDARLALALARTADDLGAAVANYVRASGFLYERGKIVGVKAIDREGGRELEIRARVVVNATGIFVDQLRQFDGAASNLLTHSRGSHIVVPARALGTSKYAVIVPKTSDNRVIFITPWLGHTVVGTTDIATSDVDADPRAADEEIAYIIQTANEYVAPSIHEGDITAVFAGLRPLVNRRMVSSAKQSREHAIDISASGLITIAGGKWTTYRKMAEDVITVAAGHAGLPRLPSKTAHMPLHGATSMPPASDFLRAYGSDADEVRRLALENPEYQSALHDRLPYTQAHVVYSARSEMARSVEDVLARRTRALFLDARAAMECAPSVARILARELCRDEAWQSEQIHNFGAVAAKASISHTFAAGN